MATSPSSLTITILSILLSLTFLPLTSSFSPALPSALLSAHASVFSATALHQSATTMTTAVSSATTLGSTALRNLVLDASRTSASSNRLDLSGIVWLEHLNIVVGDMSEATKFYVDFLGLTPDIDNGKHFNLGQQQFHLAATEEPPQRITGSIGLTVPSLQHIQERVNTAKSDLEGTMFSIHENNANDTNSKTMTVTCPWGNIFHLYDISIDDDDEDDNSTTCNNDNDASKSSQKMVKFHAEGGSYGPHRMAVRGKPGLRYVEVACPLGTINAIAEFYETLLGCTVKRSRVNEIEAATVSVGPGVHMTFVEHSNLTNNNLEKMKGVHACIYMSNFQTMYNALKERNLIWTNPRFTHLDSCDTWEEACASRTFRFKDILNVETGEKILEFEHETRPMMHGQYLKAPYYVPN